MNTMSKSQSERVWAAAKDGTRVPISLVYRKELVRDGKRPMLLEGYGFRVAMIEPPTGPPALLVFPAEDEALVTAFEAGVRNSGGHGHAGERAGAWCPSARQRRRDRHRQRGPNEFARRPGGHGYRAE